MASEASGAAAGPLPVAAGLALHAASCSAWSTAREMALSSWLTVSVSASSTSWMAAIRRASVLRAPMSLQLATWSDMLTAAASRASAASRPATIKASPADAALSIRSSPPPPLALCSLASSTDSPPPTPSRSMSASWSAASPAAAWLGAPTGCASPDEPSGCAMTAAASGVGALSYCTSTMPTTVSCGCASMGGPEDRRYSASAVISLSVGARSWCPSNAAAPSNMSHKMSSIATALPPPPPPHLPFAPS
mmetsp:Transcript_42686/g.110673  ORF Transcript_42686/g.110673 Transcript_42686/m.110673 type:complete len:250 (-) Transcript_42686:1115-1864(-)